MKFIDIARRSGRNLRTAKVRTLLTALAIGVGGFTLALTLAAGNGARDYANRLISSNFDPAELIVGRDKEISNNGTPSDKPQEYDETVASINAGGPNSSLQVKRVTQQDVDQLRSLPYVEQVREAYQINVRYISREGQKRFTGAAEPYNAAQKPEIKAGTLPNQGDIEKGKALLPDVYLEPLGFGSAEEAIGKTVQITVQKPFSAASVQAALQGGQPIDPKSLVPESTTKTYTIIGVTKKPATSLSFGILPILLNNADAKELYTYTAQGTPDYQKYLFVYVRVKDGQNDANIQAAKQDLESKGYYVQSAEDIQKTITQFVNILQIMVGVFGIITLIASVFGIINTQYISVLERTREIGLMKALGMSRRSVSRLFTLEATWIGFMGGLLGIVGGVLLTYALNPLISDKLDLGEGNYLLVNNWLQLAMLLVALMLVATIAGLLPARKAARLNPIEALRTE